MIIDANGKCPFEIRDSTGKEFKKIYDADGNLLFKNWNTIQGTPPIVFKGYNKTLKNYKIYGNTIQDGTPTPETPVEVQGCGEYDAELNGYKIPVTVSNGTNSITIPVYIGSEPLHKIDDYADYIDFERGVLVRNIKKIVSTGDENWVIWNLSATSPLERFTLSCGAHPVTKISLKCSHFKVGDGTIGTRFGGNYNDQLFFHINKTIASTVDEFKRYLQSQYSSGTPVTVWYVLATPEEEQLENPSPIQTIKGTNILSANTTIQPSEIYLKGKIKSLATHTD